MRKIRLIFKLYLQMSEKSKKNWSFWAKLISYVITTIAGFFTGNNVEQLF